MAAKILAQSILSNNIPFDAQLADKPKMVYDKDPLTQAEQFELLARYYSLLAEAFRIQVAMEGAE